MENKQVSPEEMREFYFEFQSIIGITKHMGGLRATEELIRSCRINKDKHVLEVGCGLGRTACYIAKSRGCKVVGVDISERMVEKSRERARKEGVEEKVEFRVADAQALPFRDSTFDAVISESVITFVEDRQKTISEYTRVIKLGGYIGLNECAWVKPTPPGLAEYMSRTIGAKFPAPDGWKELLEGSGLEDIEMKTYKVKALSQFADEIRQFELKELLEAYREFFSLYVKSPACRSFAKEALRMPKNIFDVFKYLGYGIYIGRK